VAIHGKEGVVGSSPTEGLTRSPCKHGVMLRLSATDENERSPGLRSGRLGLMQVSREQRCGGSEKRLRRLCRGWSGLGLSAGLDGRDASGEREGNERKEREDGLGGA
jgi:hypothetical protein